MAGNGVWYLRYRDGLIPKGSEGLRVGSRRTIGRSSGADIQIDDPQISRFHATLEPRIDGVWVEDLNSANGSFIDGQPFKSDLWKPGQLLRIGEAEFELDEYESTPNAPQVKMNARIGYAAGREAKVASFRITWCPHDQVKPKKEHALIVRSGTSLTVGRSRQCDITLDDVTVSRRHARIMTRADGAFVQGVQNGNCIILDGSSAAEASWRPGQSLDVGAYRFSLERVNDSDYDRALSGRNLRKRRRSRVSGIVDRLRIFISYSRRDIHDADQLSSSIEGQGFEVIIDRRDLPYGEEWQRELADFIRNSDSVLFLISPSSIVSEWCNWELAQVAELKKRLFPIAIAAVSLNALPLELARVHIFPQEGLFDQVRHLPQLVKALNTDRAWIKEHTRLADWAREWRARNKPGAMLLRGPALQAAEIWRKQIPRTETPAEIVLELIEASRRGRFRRRGITATAASATLIGGFVGGWIYLGLADVISSLTGRLTNISRLERELAASERRADALAKQRAGLGGVIDDLNKRVLHARVSGDKQKEDELVEEIRKLERGLRAIEEEWRHTQHVLSAEKIFRGHNQPIYALAVDRNGDVFASGSRDNLAIIWSLSTGQPPILLRPHFGDVLSVAFTPDGQYVVTGSEDKRARLWNKTDGKLLAVFSEHTSDVTTVAVTPDSQRIITGSGDATILIWDIATRKRVERLAGHTGQVNRVAVTPDGEYIFSGSSDKTLRMWRVATYHQIALLGSSQGLRGDILDLAVFMHNEKLHVVVASADNMVRIWDVGIFLEKADNPPPPLYMLNVLERGITSVAVMPDGRHVIVALADRYNSVWVWDFTTDTVVARLEGHEERVLAVAAFPDGQRILTGSADKSARTWLFSPR